MKICVMMIVKDEASRHLEKALETAVRLAGNDGVVRITDDGSTDDTVEEIQRLTSTSENVEIRSTHAQFWAHEGNARQAHYDWASRDLVDGDWVLSLDADESLNRPHRVHELIQQAEAGGYGWVGLPLYEFWTPTHHRIDGFWFGTTTQRLYKWRPNGQLRSLEMGCGSEPNYVWTAPGLYQDEVHLLHWGYLRAADRISKHAKYSSRLGGHGHNNSHVESIIHEPLLRTYEAW